MSPKILTILFLITPFVLYTAVINPFITGVGTVWSPESSIESLQVANAEYSAAISNTEAIKAKFKEVHDDYLKIDPEVLKKNKVMLPTDISEANLRNEVIAIASKEGIALNGLEVKKDSRGFRIAEYYLVNFNLNAKYPAFKKLLTEYEKSTRFYHIDLLSISRPAEVQGVEKSISEKDILSIQVRFRVHYLK